MAIDKDSAGKTTDFFGDLIMVAMEGDIIRLVSLMDRMSENEIVLLSKAIDDIRNFADAFWRAKGW